jgi:hypothetical protein
VRAGACVIAIVHQHRSALPLCAESRGVLMA